jgi:hypothetical protein
MCTRSTFILAVVATSTLSTVSAAQFEPSAASRRQLQLRQEPRLPDTDQRPPIRRVGPMEEVGAWAGMLAGYLNGRGHERTKFFGYKGPVLHILAGGVIGASAGLLIDTPIRFWRNSATLRSGACVDSAVFVRTHGRDTLSIETVEFTTAELRGTIRNDSGTTKYVAMLSNQLTVRRLDASHWAKGIAPDAQPTTLHYGLYGDTAVLRVRPARSLRKELVARNVTTLLGDAVGFQELMTRRLGRLAEADYPMINPSGDGYVHVAHLRFTGTRTVEMQIGGTSIVADVLVDGSGRILNGSYSEGAVITTTVRARCGILQW